MEYKATMFGVNNRKLNRIKGLVGEIELSLINYNHNHPIHEQYVQERINSIKRLIDEMIDLIPKYPKQ